MIRLIAVAVAVLVLAGCESTPKKPGEPLDGYPAYIELMREQDQRQQAAAAAIADGTACGGNPTCVVAAKGFAALALSGGGQRMIAPPPREPTFIEQTATLLGAVTPLAHVYAGITQSRYMRDSNDRQWQAFEALGSAPWQSLPGILGSIDNTGPVTTITVGGNYGDTRGDVVGRDQIGGDQYQGPVAGRDVIGRDQIIARRIGSPGDDRRDSPGPIESPVIVEPPVVVVPPVIIVPPPGEPPVVPVDPGADDLCARFPDATWCQ